jgi:cellulase
LTLANQIPQVNINKNGVCCQEMDIWEGNSRAQMFTPHPCKTTGPYACSGTACDQPGTCDKWGCGYNSYKAGQKTFYGPGLTLDSSKPFTVVTQFHTSDKTANGTLVEIRRLYVQNGKKFAHDFLPKTADGFTANSLTVPYCDVNGAYTAVSGGLAEQGKALMRGSVLAMSIWYSEGDNMNWLDSGAAGPCSETEGSPANIRANNPTTSVTFSNIKWGDLDSTY